MPWILVGNKSRSRNRPKKQKKVGKTPEFACSAVERVLTCGGYGFSVATLSFFLGLPPFLVEVPSVETVTTRNCLLVLFGRQSLWPHLVIRRVAAAHLANNTLAPDQNHDLRRGTITVQTLCCEKKEMLGTRNSLLKRGDLFCHGPPPAPSRARVQGMVQHVRDNQSSRLKPGLEGSIYFATPVLKTKQVPSRGSTSASIVPEGCKKEPKHPHTPSSGIFSTEAVMISQLQVYYCRGMSSLQILVKLKPSDLLDIRHCGLMRIGQLEFGVLVKGPDMAGVNLKWLNLQWLHLDVGRSKCLPKSPF